MIGVITALALGACAFWPTDASPQTKVPLYYNAGGLGSIAPNDRHALLDGAVLLTRWADTEPAPGLFDWSLIESRLAEWSAGGKPALLKTAPYGQTPITGDPQGDNDLTPPWLYDMGVPRISFAGGGKAHGGTVSVPQVWSSTFYPFYQAFLQEIALRFNSDTRVAGYVIGIGHIGNLTAQPSAGGNDAFQAAGWTVDVWERHAKRVIAMAVRLFRPKPVYVWFSPLLLQDFLVIDHLEAGKRIASYAAARGVSIIFSGLNANVAEFESTGAPDLVTHLGTLTLPSGFTMGFTDDMPLWEEDGERGRDVNGLRTELQEAVDVWESIGGKYPMFYVFQEPETSASNTLSAEFNQAVYDVVVDFIYP
jgi:hypothetical protein